MDVRDIEKELLRLRKDRKKEEEAYEKYKSDLRKKNMKEYDHNVVVVKKIGSNYKLLYHKYSIKREDNGVLGDSVRSRDKNDNKLANNISRARTAIFETIACNEWDYSVTLTTDKKKIDRYDLNGFIKKLNQMIRNDRRRRGIDVQYILIPEKCKDGAWHMHGFVKMPETEVRKNENGYLEWSRCTDNFGFTQVKKVYDMEDGKDGKLKASKYFTKYISKNVASGIEKNAKVYYSTRGLKRPQIIKKGRMTEKLQSFLPKEKFENDYIQSYILSPEQYQLISHLL